MNVKKSTFRACFAVVMAFALCFTLTGSAWAANGYDFNFAGTSDSSGAGTSGSTSASTLPVTTAGSYADQYIQDLNGTLDAGTAAELEAQCKSAFEKSSIPIYLLIVDDIGSSNVRNYAKEAYSTRGLGYGADNTGILFLIATESRDYVTVDKGTALNAFSDAYIEKLEGAVVDHLKNNDWDGAAREYITCAVTATDYYAEHGEYYVAHGSPVPGVIIGIVIGIVAAVVIALGRKKAHFTAQEAVQADNYLNSESLTLSRCDDQYVTTNVMVIAHHNDNDNSSSSSSWSDSGGFGGSSGGKF